MIIRFPVVLFLSILLVSQVAHGGEAEDARVEQGVALYDDGKYAEAKAILLPLAESGHPKAMNMVGRLHDGTPVFPDDPVIECDWYERSAEAGYASAQSNLAKCFDLGNGRPKNIEQSLLWDELAASQGNKLSQAGLAGYYVKRDRDKYLYWGQKAAANGSRAVMGLMLLNGDGDLVPDAKYSDVACVVVMIGWLGYPSDYCD